jgi:hypothetical protein
MGDVYEYEQNNAAQNRKIFGWLIGIASPSSITADVAFAASSSTK